MFVCLFCQSDSIQSKTYDPSKQNIPALSSYHFQLKSNFCDWVWILIFYLHGPCCMHTMDQADMRNNEWWIQVLLCNSKFKFSIE